MLIIPKGGCLFKHGQRNIACIGGRRYVTGVPAAKTPIPGTFFIVATANFLFFLNFAFFLLLPLWVLEHGGGEETAGRVVGISGFSGLIALPVIGTLIDRVGGRVFMICGMFGAALCSVWFLFIDGIGPELYIAKALQGVAFTAAFTGGQTLAVLFAPFVRRAEAIGWFGISTILTHAISPMIGEEIILRFGFDGVFVAGAVVGTIGFLLACTLPRPPELFVPADRADSDPAFARRALAAATIAMLLYGFGFGATSTFVPVMMERFDLGRVGVFFAAWSVAAVAMRVIFGSASDRYGRRAVIIPAMLTMSLAVALLAFVRSQAGVAVAGVVFGIAQGLLYPTMNAFVADLSHPANIGRSQSLFSGSYSLGIATCSFFFGSIAEHYGFRAMFLVALAITLVGFAVFVAYATEPAAAMKRREAGETEPVADIPTGWPKLPI